VPFGRNRSSCRDQNFFWGNGCFEASLHRAHLYAPRAQPAQPVGVDAFAQGLREYDLDEQFMTLAKLHAHLVLGLDMRECEVAADIEWARPIRLLRIFESVFPGGLSVLRERPFPFRATEPPAFRRGSEDAVLAEAKS
jgi:hypothetical protein